MEHHQARSESARAAMTLLGGCGLAGLDGTVTGERAFSVRNEFPDVWYGLLDADGGDEVERRMRIALPLSRADFSSPSDDGLWLQELSLFCVRKKGFVEELPISRVRLLSPGGAVCSSAGVRTRAGIVSTRRATGMPWQPFIGCDPTGTWIFQLPDAQAQKAWFIDQLIVDLVLMTTVSAQPPVLA